MPGGVGTDQRAAGSKDLVRKDEMRKRDCERYELASGSNKTLDRSAVCKSQMDFTS
jgi:hypothetical protein